GAAPSRCGWAPIRRSSSRTPVTTSFAAGAVEQVEHPYGAGVGHLDEDRAARLQAELERVPVPPEAGQAGQQDGAGQRIAGHDDES
ncbi:hypothetical protein, partial [Micromonospora carbonacea]|uniref:hypothetical protein n=1 Tax=Micromonospora carbonacea TaxID=47853 RepID=UPI0033F131F8